MTEEIPGGGAAEFLLRPGDRAGGGRFRLERMIGRGGMGTVWQAVDERLNEPVALKFISERIRGNASSLAAMRRETSRSHSLSHQNIVRIHDLHESPQEPAFISMEYVAGRNLHDLAKGQENRAFSLDEVWRWTRQLCAALGYAHSRGVIHRDLKPANLMLTDAGELKLADFGLAAAFHDPAAAEDQSVSGTPAYMSPQQFAGAPASVADDIYSLGACLFELLAGEPVFKGPDMRQKIEFEPAPMLSTVMARRGLATQIPEEFEDLLQQCLSKNPQTRPQSAEAFLEIAKKALADDSPTPENLRSRWWERHPRVIMAAAGTAILVLWFALKPARPRYLDLKTAQVAASSFLTNSLPPAAFDGLHRDYDIREEQRWASVAVIGDANEWITVDLGQDMHLREVVIDWELAYAKDFTIRTRTSSEGWTNDPAQWTQRGRVTGFKEISRSAVNAITNIMDVVFDFRRGKVRLGDWMIAGETVIEDGPFVARHLMINPTARGMNNPGVYSIHEVQIAARPAR